MIILKFNFYHFIVIDVFAVIVVIVIFLGDLHAIIARESARLDRNSILNMDTILEDSLNRLVLSEWRGRGGDGKEGGKGLQRLGR